MIDFIKKDSYDIKDLARIVSILRAPGGCPWDGEQTHASLRRGLIEESCEVIEAINEENPEHLKEELGDLLFAAVNVSRVVGVDPEEALNGATEKFISRFAKVEQLARESGRDMAQMGLSELEELWEMAKRT